MKNLQEATAKTAMFTSAASDAASLRKIICDCTVKICVEIFGTNVRAIVLTGSVARDEASFVRKATCWEVLGDAEFMVVFKKNGAVPPQEQIDDARKRIEHALGLQEIVCKIDLGVVDANYFRRLPPHIFSYELRHCGRVIQGDSQILQTIPDFPATAISLEDAWRLLCNRLLEILECAPELTNREDAPSSELRYKIVKLYLDMATSFLVFLGAYAPTYRERQRIIGKLAVNQQEHTNSYPFEIGKFAEVIESCTEQKLAARDIATRDIDLSWRTAVETAHALWRWELSSLANETRDVSDGDLLRRWMTKQPLQAKIRGWAYVVRARAWRDNSRVWAHWLKLCWTASPRYWIYFVASRLLFQRASEPKSLQRRDDDPAWVSLTRFLPVRRIKSQPQAASWESAAADTFWNYREFLVGTRA